MNSGSSSAMGEGARRRRKGRREFAPRDFFSESGLIFVGRMGRIMQRMNGRCGKQE